MKYFESFLLKDYPQIAIPPPLTPPYDKIAKKTTQGKLKEIWKRKDVATIWYSSQEVSPSILLTVFG